MHVWFQNRRQRHQTKAPTPGGADAVAAAVAAPEPGSPAPGSPAPSKKPAGATVFSWSEARPGVRVHDLKQVQAGDAPMRVTRRRTTAEPRDSAADATAEAEAAEAAEAQAAEEHVQAAAAELAAAVVAADGGPIVSLIAATATQAETAPAVAGAMQAAMEVDGWSLGGYGQGGQPAERRKSSGASGSESESSRASAG